MGQYDDILVNNDTVLLDVDHLRPSVTLMEITYEVVELQEDEEAMVEGDATHANDDVVLFDFVSDVDFQRSAVLLQGIEYEATEGEMLSEEDIPVAASEEVASEDGDDTWLGCSDYEDEQEEGEESEDDMSADLDGLDGVSFSVAVYRMINEDA
ncbi:hypothetical protein CAPTEDRAFT_193544 [Capitella teleta]|uniref:Uncharacterized protein n=1 Tax=Capitella teleta TaxID=283909 RepID=R7TJH8_CAPTE|nr:hypothetical protein CAPTEDRAFT_193544 [Capitella teleta]|eukprot:ELT93978.1 hypothetical protein CAPTEDRAFT_193544 [Capitella teleta]